MTKITEALIRKRAEHNECIISTLEEISLHQQDIERIEYIDKWCRDLKILYLQSNLIPKIENVGRLKKLEYLNLALNNVEKIENLEGCESLKKLDLTVNFIGELTSIETLRDHYNLRTLYLTGNPCVDFEGYRQFVIATLPQIEYLDGIEIEKSERIKAVQILPELRDGIVEQQNRYRIKREKERKEGEARLNGKTTEEKKAGTNWYTNTDENKHGDTEERKGEQEDEKTADEKDKAFWQEKTAFTPESRMEVHKHMEEKRKREQKEYNSPDPPKRERKLVGDDGRRYNVNEAKIDFHLKDEEEEGNIVLDVSVYKYLDTSLCDVDVQPDYVIVNIKGKILQLVLPEEVQPDRSSAKRSTTTGHLLITMPKARQVVIPKKTKSARSTKDQEKKENKQQSRVQHEKLEVDPSVLKTVNIDGLTKSDRPACKAPLGSKFSKPVVERPNSEDFVDDPDVPPLI